MIKNGVNNVWLQQRKKKDSGKLHYIGNLAFNDRLTV